MNLLYILIASIVVVVVIFFVVYHTTTSTGSSALHTITLDGSTLYKGSMIPVVSSDGSTNVLIGTNTGLIHYSTHTKISTTVDPSIATGLAYDDAAQQFMLLEADGTMSNITLDTDASGNITAMKQMIGLGCSSLYDTTDGYFMMFGGVPSVTGASGTKNPANGAYGMIQMKIT